jgi:hypothetical protein
LWKQHRTQPDKLYKNREFSILVKKTRRISALHCAPWWLRRLSLLLAVAPFLFAQQALRPQGRQR